jgi:hypothetical protein
VFQYNALPEKDLQYKLLALSGDDNTQTFLRIRVIKICILSISVEIASSQNKEPGLDMGHFFSSSFSSHLAPPPLRSLTPYPMQMSMIPMKLKCSSPEIATQIMAYCGNLEIFMSW